MPNDEGITESEARKVVAEDIFWESGGSVIDKVGGNYLEADVKPGARILWLEAKERPVILSKIWRSKT